MAGLCTIRRLLAFFLALAAGCAQHRPKLDAQALQIAVQDYDRRMAAESNQRLNRTVARIEHEYDDYLAGRTKNPPTIDVLILSGGGEYGAFGAAYLRGWGSVSDADMARPEFDIVNGVSTGALISPFAFVGDSRAYAKIVNLYEHPQADWVATRFLFFLPSNPSFLTIAGLENELRRQIDMDFIRSVAEGAERGRVLCVGSTNLDYGKQRVFDLGVEAELCVRTGDPRPFHEMLLASSAIPGVFPPRIIDGSLHVDGGVTSNILYNPDMTSPNSAIGVWRQKHPDQ